MKRKDISAEYERAAEEYADAAEEAIDYTKQCLKEDNLIGAISSSVRALSAANDAVGSAYISNQQAAWEVALNTLRRTIRMFNRVQKLVAEEAG